MSVVGREIPPYMWERGFDLATMSWPDGGGAYAQVGEGTFSWVPQQAFGGEAESFPVAVESVSYSWDQKMCGASYGRDSQVVYPKRRERSSVSVRLRFRDPKHMLAFGEWVWRIYGKTIDGAYTGNLVFRYRPYRGGAKTLYVSVPKVEMPFKSDMDPAPSMDVALDVIRDEEDASDEHGSTTDVSGKDQYTDYLVKSGDYSLVSNGSSDSDYTAKAKAALDGIYASMSDAVGSAISSAIGARKTTREVR